MKISSARYSSGRSRLSSETSWSRLRRRWMTVSRVSRGRLESGGARLLDRVRQLHVQEPRRGLQPLQVVGEPEHGGPVGRLVAANALEDPGAVVETVRADVDLGVAPVDELARHPDLLGLAH